MKRRSAVPILTLAAAAVAGAFLLESPPALSIDPPARDPGVRGGTAGAGGTLPGLSTTQTAFFGRGLEEFNAAEEPDEGLGPRMNLDSCGGCHSQPAIGGTSPAINPEVAMATEAGARNEVPFFVTPNGPAREARFKFQADGVTRDGGVHNLYVITGRSDAPIYCQIAQEDFDAQAARNNLIFRIHPPTF